VKGKQSPKRPGAKPANAKVEAKRPVARTSGKGQGSRVGDLEKRLAEALKREAAALEQQTATSEILRVISSSPTDVRPVFDAIVRSADDLCGGVNSAAFLYDGELLHNIALSDPSPEASEEIARHFPQRPNLEFGAGRVVLTGAIVHSAEVLNDPRFGEGARRVLRLRGVRALLLAPMLHDGRVSEEPGRDGCHVYVHDSGAQRAEQPRRRREAAVRAPCVSTKSAHGAKIGFATLVSS
jgi:GAF domain